MCAFHATGGGGGGGGKGAGITVYIYITLFLSKDYICVYKYLLFAYLSDVFMVEWDSWWV